MATKKKKLGTEFTTILPKRQAVAPAVTPGGGLEPTPVTPDNVIAPFDILNAQGEKIGTKGISPDPASAAFSNNLSTVNNQTAVSPLNKQQTNGIEPIQPKVSTLEETGPIKVAPTVTPGPGVGEVAVKAVPATPEEVDTKIEELKVKKPGFFEGLGEEGQQALIRAALSAGTSILEANDPFGAAAIISRGVQTGFETADKIRGAQAKGKAAKRAETRTVAGEKREETKLGLEERRVKVAERAKPVKEAETAEGRIKKAEAEAVKASRAEGGGIAEQLESAEAARGVQEFIEGRGVVEQEGTPERTEGGFLGFGGTKVPATPPKIRFPRRASASVEKVRRGVEARQKTPPQGLQPIGTDKRTGRTVLQDAQGKLFLGG